MPIDPATPLDVTHLLTFFGGAAAGVVGVVATGVVGAAGTYIADRFTDRRREKEKKRAAAAKFERVLKHMPELLAELRNDLRANGELVLRELVILSNERISFNHSKPRIVVYVSKHAAAKNQVGLLVSEGYVEVIRSSDTPIYRLTENFVDSLQNSA